jgi:hypothetical protein
VIVLYIAVMIITAGMIGGVRDGMEGVLDLATIIFWPVALAFWTLYWIIKSLYRFGQWLGKGLDG